MKITNCLTIRINTENTAALSPYVFGHNLEHTRAAVNGGLSAQMLKNRKFAGKPSKNEGVAAHWFGIGEKTLFQTDVPAYTKHNCLERMYRKNEIFAQSVMNLREGQKAGIGQQEIPLAAGQTYEFRTVTKAARPVLLHIGLTDRYGREVYAETAVSVPAESPEETWHTTAFTLTSPVQEEDGCVRFWFTEQTEVVFGALSMLPQGHFRGMRPDVVARLKEIGPGVIRWPGGNFAGEYRWKDGLLPVDQRAPLQTQSGMEIETQPYTDGYDFHEIAIDDFIALCREVGAEPFLTINPVWNTPEESAQWVEYCNGGSDTEYGRLRAERGFPEPYHVRYWSLGNEMGYGHMEGPMRAKEYAEMAQKHADAMLSVTPDLHLFSSGPYPNGDWAENSAKTLYPAAKYVSLHHYSGTRYRYTTPEEIKATYEAILESPKRAMQCARDMRACLDKVEKNLHISFDEWNYWYAWYRPSCVAEGMFAAQMMHGFLSESDALDMPVVCYFQPVGEGAILIGKYDSRLTANGQIFAMMQNHRGGRLCPIEGNENYDAVATVKDGVLTVTLLNTAYDSKRTFRILAEGELLDALLLSSDDVTPHSFFEQSKLEVRAENGALEAVLPPHSAAMIRIRPTSR